MNFFLNELSLHNQFADLQQFLPSLESILRCKDIINRSGFRFYCERTLTNRHVFQNISFSKAILSQPNPDLKRLVRIWLDKTGPFWDALPKHNPDDYFEYEQEPLENASLAEAAFQIVTEQSECCLLSFSPSNFEKTPLLILWYKPDPPKEVEVLNFWEHDTLQTHLAQLRLPVTSWGNMLERVKSDFQNLIFLDSVVLALEKEAFNTAIANRIIFQLELLNRLATCFDEQGQSTPMWHEIYHNYFTGERAIFTDESISNKSKFEKNMTFRKPNGEEIFCPFHGKISHRTFRLHFSWPIRWNEPIYIAYIGPKITKH